MAVKPIFDTVPMLAEALTAGHGAKYKRLANALEVGIREGRIDAGMKLPPHRRLADRLGVTIGTVSRAYAELERLGLVVARVGDGTFVRQRELERKHDAGFRNFVEDCRSSTTWVVTCIFLARKSASWRMACTIWSAILRLSAS